MTAMEKYLGRAGITGFALLVLAVAALEMTGRSRSLKTATQTTPEPRREQISRDAPHAVPPPMPETTHDVMFVAAPIAPLPAGATSVPDEDLLKLSALVDLANARDHRPDKSRWTQAMPIAGKLLEGPCDCEQRNWLNHFVEMGNAALSNSDSEYYELANVLATLGRNDRDAMAISHRPNQ